jgi:hypothetical protein
MDWVEGIGKSMNEGRVRAMVRIRARLTPIINRNLFLTLIGRLGTVTLNLTL